MDKKRVRGEREEKEREREGPKGEEDFCEPS